MGRKKKINASGGVSVVKLDRQIPNTPVVRRSAFGWVNWGRRNDYPDLILGLYSQSPTLSACVNFCVTALIGGGVDYEAMRADGVQLAPNYRYGYNELIRRCAFDYTLFGGFALQVVKNRDGRTYSIYHQPFNSVRSGERDSDGVVTDYYICRDWTATSKYPPVKIPSLTMRDDGEWNLKAGQVYLLVPDTFSALGDYYPTPSWHAALGPVQTEVEMVKYDLRTASNLFCPAGALSLPPAESDEQKQAILKSVQDMFAGSDNAQQLLVSFRNDSEDEPIKFTPFESQKDKVDLYGDANDRTVDRILSSFGIPSRALIGLPLGNVGFSSEAAILESAFALYNTLRGNDNRNAVVGVMNECLTHNGVNVELVLKPLVFGTQTSTDSAESTQDISEENIIEQS